MALGGMSPYARRRLRGGCDAAQVNHFPGTWELGRKDKLYRNLGKFRRSHGAAFDIVPRHYVLPRDTDEWRTEYERLPHLVYILKPCCSSRGRGIRVLRKPSDVPREKDGSIKECLVQRYITNPHLIDGYKYDLRLYVVVTCFDPLRVYLYHEVRLRPFAPSSVVCCPSEATE
jgi:tubulin polyglutamylase TTLL4